MAQIQFKTTLEIVYIMPKIMGYPNWNCDEGFYTTIVIHWEYYY